MSEHPHRPAPRSSRRFRARLWMLFFAVLALIGLGTVVLTLTDWSGLEAFGVGLVLVLVAVFVARFAISRLARPVELLTEATRRFGGGDLGHRIPVPARLQRWFERRRRHAGSPRTMDELVALALAWNQMAERIERLVAGQRELMANVSHELRSPLARVRLALELVPRTPENAARLDDVALDLDDL
jgi:signal transduction histidine kinase